MSNCPVFNTTDLLGKKWTFFILQELEHNNSGFNSISKMLKSARPKVLSRRLKDLEEKGVIQKETLSVKPLRTRYGLTDKGKKLNLILNELKDWHLEYTKESLPCKKTKCSECNLF